MKKEQMVEQLRAMAAGRGDGIDLNTPSNWIIKGLKQPDLFFEHLAKLLPPDAIIYVEGVTINAEAAAFYSSHRARNAVAVVRDTIFPVPDTYHLSFSNEVVAGMRMLLKKHPASEMFDHIKAYRDTALLFAFHDAFSGWLQISEHVPDETVAEFCRALGVLCEKEKTKFRKPEDLLKILEMFENPGKIRYAGESKWRRWWRRLTGR
jgi:hypothetical protein